MRLTNLILPELEQLLRTAPGEIADYLSDFHPEDIADLLERAEADFSARLLRVLPPEMAADALEYVDQDRQIALVKALGAAEAAPIVDEMASDDRADLVAELEPSTATELLERMDPLEAKDVRELVQWPEGTAGALMTTDYVAVKVGTRVGEVIAEVRRKANEAETIYYVFVEDERGKLCGVASLRQIITASDDARIDDVMNEKLFTLDPMADREDVVRLAQKYDLLAVPLVDDQHRLIGLATIDDVVDVAEQEATEDMHRMSGVEPVEDPYITTAFWTLVKKRATWLVFIFIGELFTGTALRHFEEAIAAATALVFFVPLVISSGGNSGSQSATLVIRAMAVGELHLKQFIKVVGRELMMGLVLGAILGTIGLIRAFMWGNGPGVAATVGLTLVAVVTVGAVAGAALPIGLRALKLDPAFASSPFIATAIDVIGIIIYFTVAHAVLGTHI